MRIASALVCLTLFGCEASPSSHSANSDKNTPVGVVVAPTDTNANNASDDADKEGTADGSTDTGSDTAPTKVDTSTAPPPDPCQQLKDANTRWYRIDGKGNFEIFSKPSNADLCATTISGEGAVIDGEVLLGNELPLQHEDEKWKSTVVIVGDHLTYTLYKFGTLYITIECYR